MGVKNVITIGQITLTAVCEKICPCENAMLENLVGTGLYRVNCFSTHTEGIPMTTTQGRESV